MRKHCSSMADVKPLFCTVTLLLFWVKPGSIDSTNQGQERISDVTEGCPNSQLTEYHMKIFGRKYDNRNDLIDVDLDNGISKMDDVNIDVTNSNTERSCKRLKIYNKTRKKLKGSKNHRKRLKKKKKFHKSVRKRNNKIKYK